MSSKVTINQSKGVRVVGLVTIIAGVVLIVSGALAYWQVSAQLRAENITVSEDADFFAGQRVAGPFTAYSQASVINKHARALSDGKTYAELDQDDPLRTQVMNASFLRTSLFTSVVAFGLSALVAGAGVLFVLLGWALRRVSAGPAIVVENFDSPAPRHGGSATDAPHEAAPADLAPATALSAEVSDAAEAPATRIARRSAATAVVAPPEDDGAETLGGATSGASIVESLSRHSKASETTPVRVPTGVTPESSDDAWAPAPPSEPVVAVAEPVVSDLPDPEPEPIAVQHEAIPVPPEFVPATPAQSWDSPVDRAGSTPASEPVAVPAEIDDVPTPEPPINLADSLDKPEPTQQ